jgi:3,4-dihydroxy-2-butanone 4-phosphate synthase
MQIIMLAKEMRIVRHTILLVLLLSLSCLTNCNVNHNAGKAVLVLDVFDPENPGGFILPGAFDSQQVRVFLNGESLGTTPIEFSSQKLRKLGLPKFQKIHQGDGVSWVTWSMGKSSRLTVTDAHDQDKKQEIKLFSLNKDSEIRISSFLTQPTKEGGIRISVTIKKSEDEDSEVK